MHNQMTISYLILVEMISEIESELDLVTTNVVEEKSLIFNRKKSTSESFDWDAIFSQKLYYGLESPSVLFSGELQGLRQYIAILI